MITIKEFTFNPFQENTFVLYDETKECIIIDPGCYMSGEKRLLSDFIQKNGLNPVLLINTHCHLDHIFGNAFIKEKFNISLAIHEGELPLLNSFERVAEMYNIPVEPTPAADRFIEDGEEVRFGNSSLTAILTPGHSPASLSFYSEKQRFVIAGDVLFYRSIGRTDLPGGDHKTLIKSIEERLFPLGDDIVVYCGHGQSTTIGYERKHNPFLI